MTAPGIAAGRPQELRDSGANGALDDQNWTTLQPIINWRYWRTKRFWYQVPGKSVTLVVLFSGSYSGVAHFISLRPYFQFH